MKCWAFAVVVCAGIALLAIAGHANAQQTEASLTLDAEAPAAVLIPNGEAQKVLVEWAYTPDAASRATSAADTSYTLAWTPAPACEAPGLIITGPSSTTITASPVIQETYTGTQEFLIVAMQDAPGETPVTCTFHGTVQALNSQSAAASASTAMSATVAYYGLLTTNVATTQNEVGPGGTIAYDVEVTNRGNARSNVVVTALDVPEGWTVETPAPFLLESANHGATATARTVQVLVTVPESGGWNNREATFSIQVVASSTITGEPAGERSVEVNFLARARGWSWAGPAPLFPLALVAVVAAVVYVAPRLRRKKPATTQVLRSGPALPPGSPTTRTTIRAAATPSTRRRSPRP